MASTSATKPPATPKSSLKQPPASTTPSNTPASSKPSRVLFQESSFIPTSRISPTADMSKQFDSPREAMKAKHPFVGDMVNIKSNLAKITPIIFQLVHYTHGSRGSF